jgi:WD40 repeat protein
VWLPFKGDNGTVTQHFVLNTGEDNEWRSMASVENVSWTCNGRFLYVCISEGSVFVYDLESNTKQLFKRPAGRDKAWVYNGFHGLIEKEGEDAFFLSVDGDSKVRYWHTPLRLRPSWWEKQDGEATDVSSKKTPFPETGKYVKVTKPLVTGE